MGENLDPSNEEDAQFYIHTKFVLEQIQRYLLKDGTINKNQFVTMLRRYGTVACVFFKHRGKGDLTDFFSEVSSYFDTERSI